MLTKGFYFYSSELEKKIIILYRLKSSKVFLESLNLIESKNLSNFISENNLIVEKFQNINNTSLIKLVKIINSYLKGQRVNLYDSIRKLGIIIDYNKTIKTDFASSVIRELLKVKYGETISYSELASKLNSKAYRAVGNIMRKNPYPIIIPCHRVINKNGTIGGFMGSNNNESSLNLKSQLIKLEKNSRS